MDAEKRKSRQNLRLNIMINENDWFELIGRLQKLRSKLPYHINLIDELHADENAHTRILIKLLKYKEENKYPILNSFLGLLSSYCSEIPDFIKSPEIKFGKEYIDGSIKGFDSYGNKFGIFIENKIHWAKDQNQQIERYVESFKKDVSAKNIYVVYLTSNGFKKVDNSSLTPKAKFDLDVTDDDNGRFIPINYRDDILPWLKEIVLPNCKIKEEYLLSAIQQYIDHLEGLLSLRKIDKENNSIMETSIIEKLGLKESDSVVYKYNELTKAGTALEGIKGNIDNIRRELAKKYVIEPFKHITKNYFQQWSNNLRIVGINKDAITKHDYLFIFYNEWGWEIHFEWWPLTVDKLVNGSKYTLYLHTEEKKKSFKQVLLKDEEFVRITKDIKANIDDPKSNVVFQKTYYAEKSFACMNETEQKVFLEKVYNEIAPMIPVIDRLLQKEQEKIKD